MLEKKEIRKKLLKIRKKNYFEISSRCFNPIIKFLKIGNKTTNISLYFPVNYEVNTINIIELLKKKKVKMLFPVIKNNNKMNFIEWNNNDPLKVSSHGILEPVLNKKKLVPDIMLIPLLAFDEQNNRLGYGKGYYDRFLNKYLKEKKKLITIGIAFSFQRYKKLPLSRFDVKLDYILTEKGIEI